MSADQDLTLFARTNFRHPKRPFGIRRADRRAHMYLIGKTGTGKSSLLEFLLRQDIARGEGVALLDPHGDLVERVLASVPESRRKDLVYFNVADMRAPLGFNPLDRVPPNKRSLAASGVLDAFKKLWPESWGPRLEHILRNAILALLEQPEATFADVLRLLDDEDFRHNAAGRVANHQVRDFWLREYERYPKNFRAEAIAPVQNKVGAFLADPILNRILTQPKSSFDLRAIMDEGRILLVNLAKGRIGADAAGLLGALLVSHIGLAALSRADQREEDRRDFYVYVDELQTFATLSFANMLAELRKYRVGMVLAHQYLAQLDRAIRDAVLGNVGTLISFRVGASDAEALAQEFSPDIEALDLTRLPNFHIYLQLMVDGAPTTPFSGETLAPSS